MVYWLISLPLIGKRTDRTWEVLQEKITHGAGLGTSYKLDVPDLRVGTLDSLMALSDELLKINNSMDVVVAKIRRTVVDVSGLEALAGLKVNNLPPEAYLTRFKWEEQKFPSRRPLKETVEKIVEITTHLEDDLKTKLADYNGLKAQLSSILRKTQGSLAVRDVSGLVKPEQVVDSENLTTLFVVVSKFSLKEWNTSYEKLSDYVVPRSSKVVSDDNEYALCSVVLFKRVVDEFKHAARTKGYQVREYSAAGSSGESVSVATSADLVRRELESRKSALEQWARTAYGESFSCLVHVLVVRVFVESILRYGLPPQFLGAVVKPHDKCEAKLRAVLSSEFGQGVRHFKDEGTSSLALAGDSELFSYVSASINIDTGL